jgi:hypothetical protein
VTSAPAAPIRRRLALVSRVMAPLAPLLLGLTLVSAVHQPAAGLGSIDAACTVPAGRSGKARPRFFVEVSGAVLPKGREGQWRELDSEAALHALSEGKQPPNTEAIVKPTRGGTLVSMYFQDRSAEWAHVVDYCFRSSGPLARLQGTYNSLKAVVAGPAIRRRRTIYYDAQGGVLRSTTGVFDLDSDRPLPQAQFLDEEDPLYTSVRALPFSSDLLPPLPPIETDPDGFMSAVKERLPAVKVCWERAVKARPGLAGKAVGRWTVDPAGKVRDFTWQSDEIKSPVFAGCAQKVIEGWEFPKRGGPATISFPFLFAGPGAEVSLAPP